MSKAFVALLVLCLTCSSVMMLAPVNASKTIVVPDDYSTIGAAIENAGEGDTIYVKIGTYEETTLTVNKSISLIGEDKANTILNLTPPFEGAMAFNMDGTPVGGYHDGMNIDSDNVKLSEFTIVCNTSRIVVSGSRTQLTNNNLTTNVFLREGNHRSVIGNTIHYLHSESDNTVIAKNILSGLSSYGSNVRLEKNIVTDFFNFYSGHLVEGNIITAVFGLSIRGSGNTVVNNTVINTDLAVGFLNFKDAAGSVIFNNNFINNTRKIELSILVRSPYVAVWDKGGSVGGNYWSDYLFKYPNATEIDGSGFGDTAYVIDEYNQDNYPLMRPVDIDPDLLSMLSSPLVTDYVPPQISVLSPINETYNETSVSLVFAVDEAVNWTGYSLDGQDNVTITGNATIADLPNGFHNVTVYAEDSFGNVGVSETILFTVDVPFPTALVATVSAASVVIAGAGLLLYFKKRKH